MTRFGVLAVCTANICRSPMMEIMLRDRLDPTRFEVASAGVQAWRDAPMDASAAAELGRFGLEATTFRSHAISTYLVESADLILTATKDHRARVLEDDPRALRWTFTLREFAGLCQALPDDITDPVGLVSAASRARQKFSGPPDVDDPYRRGPAAHRSAADTIHAAVEIIAERLGRTV